MLRHPQEMTNPGDGAPGVATTQVDAELTRMMSTAAGRFGPKNTPASRTQIVSNKNGANPS